jgi:hypothetical protein
MGYGVRASLGYPRTQYNKRSGRSSRKLLLDAGLYVYMHAIRLKEPRLNNPLHPKSSISTSTFNLQQLTQHETNISLAYAYSFLAGLGSC